jgi:anti-anti-sigma factor
MNERKRKTWLSFEERNRTSMEIVTEEQQGRVPVTIFHIEGEVNAASSGELQQQAEDAVAGGTRYLLLDLTHVPFMDSGGLRAIHYIFMLFRKDTAEESAQAVRKGIAAGTYSAPHLKLLKPNDNVVQALKMAGFDMFLEIHSNLKKAVASF